MSSKKWVEIFILLAIITCTFIIYSNSLNNKFLNWDDDKQITENHLIKNINSLTFSKLYEYDKHTSLTLFTYALNYHFGKLNPYGYHIINLLFHLFNILLVYFLVFSITENKTVSFISIILFAWHPMRVESVVWISERKDLLYVCFSLLAIHSYLKYLKRNNILWLLMVIILTWLASVSKIQSIVLPLLLLLIDLKNKRKINTSLLFEKIILFYVILIFNVENSRLLLFHGLCLLYLFITLYVIFKIERNKINPYKLILISLLLVLISIPFKIVLIYVPIFLLLDFEKSFDFILKLKYKILKYRKGIFIILSSLLVLAIVYFAVFSHPLKFWSSQIDGEYSYSLIERFFISCYSLSFYIFKFFLPINLNAINPYPPIINGFLPVIYYISTSLLIIVIFFIARKTFLLKKGITNQVFWILFFLINISVVLHLIPIKGRLVVADRYSYFAYLGLFVLAGYFFEFLNKKSFFKPFLKYLSILIFLILALLTIQRNKVWKDNFTLYSDVIQKNSSISFAYWNLGTAFLEINNYTEALTNLNKATENKCSIIDKSGILCSRGWVKYKLNDTIGAINDLKESINLFQNNAVSYNNLGWIYYESQKFDQATIEYNKAISSDSTSLLAWVNMGILNNEINKFEDAIKYFNKAIKINPEYYFTYNNIGWSYYNLKRFNEAIAFYSKALDMNSTYELSYYNRAFAKMDIKDFHGAILDFEKSINLNPNRVYNYYYCGWAYFNIKDIKSACNYWLSSYKKGCRDAENTLKNFCK